MKDIEFNPQSTWVLIIGTSNYIYPTAGGLRNLILGTVSRVFTSALFKNVPQTPASTDVTALPLQKVRRARPPSGLLVAYQSVSQNAIAIKVRN